MGCRRFALRRFARCRRSLRLLRANLRASCGCHFWLVEVDALGGLDERGVAGVVEAVFFVDVGYEKQGDVG